MKLSPTEDNVVVKIEKAPTRSRGGIELPPSKTDKSQRGTIIAIGPGKAKEDGTRIPPNFPVGATVLFNQHAGLQVETEESLMIMKEWDVLAVVDG